jgi:PAS domain S-box-containing protein
MGVTTEDIKGKTVYELWPSEHAEIYHQKDLELMQNRQHQEYEFTVKDRNGQLRSVMFAKDIFLDANGEIAGMVGAFLDITERKQAEVEREQLITELEAKNAELERFTYTVSHDLKSPLITIKGFLGLLEQDVEKGDTERLHTDMQHIRKATDTMHQLLEDLLELSRIGRLMNSPQSLSFGDLAHEALERVASQIAECGVHVTITPDLPGVYGDRLRLLEVLQNLLENAMKFLGDQPEPQIEIGAQAGADGPVLYVADNGIGIDPRYHDKVFGLFERLDPEIEGTGVGLALVKRIIEVHGGRIWVESEGPGCGSTFYFTLPQQGA